MDLDAIFDEVHADSVVPPPAQGVAAVANAAPIRRLPTAAEVQGESGFGTNVASGVLGGIAGFGDLFDLGAKALGSVTPDFLESEPLNAGDKLRSLFDSLTGVEGSTQINPHSYANKFGQYLPYALGGLPAGVAKGALAAPSALAKGLASVLGTNTVASGGGYLGSNIGEAIGGEKYGAPIGEIIGAVGAPAALTQVGKAGSFLKDALLPNLPERARKQLSQSLSEQLDVPSVVNKLATVKKSEFSPYMPTGELISDPKLGFLTEELKAATGEGRLADAARRRSDALAMDRAGARSQTFLEAQGPYAGKEISGATLRGALTEGLGEQSARTTNYYEASKVGPGTIPIMPVKIAIQDELKALKKVGGDIDGSTRKLVKKIITSDPNLPVAKLDALRIRAGDLKETFYGSKNASKKAGARLLNKVVKKIDEQTLFATTPEAKGVTSSGIVKGIKGEQRKNLLRGREEFKKKGEVFVDGTVGKILERGGFRKYNLEDATVADKMIASPQAAKDIMAALKTKTVGGKQLLDKKKAIEAYGSHLMEELGNRSRHPMTEEFVAAKFKKNWEKVQPIAIDEGFLSRSQVKAINAVSDDLQRVENFKKSVGRQASDREIAQLGIAGAIKRASTLPNKVKVPFLSRLFEGVSENRAKRVQTLIDQKMIEIAFDPKFAYNFLSKVTPESVNKVAKEVYHRVMAIPGFIEGAKNATSNVPTSTESDVNSYANGSKKKDSTGPIEPINDTGMDDLVSAVIRQESGGRVNAVNKKSGAQGLMQLMPATGRELHKKAGIKGPYDPFDADQNKTLGTLYLQQLISKYKGDKELALAAYNWGMGNVDRTLKQTGKKSFSDIKHLVPKETADYVPSVLQRAAKSRIKLVEA